MYLIKHDIVCFHIVSVPSLPPLLYTKWNTKILQSYLLSHTCFRKKKLTFIKKPTLPTHLYCGKYFSATCMKNLVSDILKVFREVVELNLLMALSLRLFQHQSEGYFRQVSYEHNLTLCGTVRSTAIRFHKTITLPTATCCQRGAPDIHSR